MIHVLKELASSTQINEMLQEYDKMIKIVVDIRRRVFFRRRGDAFRLRIRFA